MQNNPFDLATYWLTKPEKAPRTVVLFLFLGLGVPYAHRTHLHVKMHADLQEYYSCKGFVYLVCKAQRGIAVVRRYTWRLVQTLKPYPNF